MKGNQDDDDQSKRRSYWRVEKATCWTRIPARLHNGGKPLLHLRRAGLPLSSKPAACFARQGLAEVCDFGLQLGNGFAILPILGTIIIRQRRRLPYQYIWP